MIQRIQTIYLLIAAILIFLMHFLPVAKIPDEAGEIIVFRSYGFFSESNAERIMPAWPFFILVCVVFILFLTAIFLFKKRNIQARVCRLNMILIVGLVGLATFYLLYVHKEAGGYGISVRITVLFPFISIILTWLALRGIIRDELLVRSVDKIR